MPAVTAKERPLDPSSLAFHKHLLLFITILKRLHWYIHWIRNHWDEMKICSISVDYVWRPNTNFYTIMFMVRHAKSCLYDLHWFQLNWMSESASVTGIFWYAYHCFQSHFLDLFTCSKFMSSVDFTAISYVYSL